MRKSILRIYFWLAVAALAYGLWYGITGWGIPCYYVTVHGFECPGCGLSRMLFSILKLQLGKAFLYNPVGFVAFFLWNTVAALCFWGKTKFAQKPVFTCSLLTVTMAAFLVQGLIRNLQFYS